MTPALFPSSDCADEPGLLTRRQLLAASALGLALPSMWAQAQAGDVTKIGDVTFPNKIVLNGKTLVLNGAGLRYKAIFKVYALALYLPERTQDATKAITMPGEKRIHMVTLRDVDPNDLGRMFTRAFQENVDRATFSKLTNNIVYLGRLFATAKPLGKGDNMIIDYVPGQGTVITHGTVKETNVMKEPEQMTAFLSIWLGKHPADVRLRDQLLGIPPQ